MSKEEWNLCVLSRGGFNFIVFFHTKIATQLLDSDLQRASKLLIRLRYWSRAISFSFQANCLIAITTTIFPPAIIWAFFRLIKNHEMKPGNELLTILDDDCAGSECLQFCYEEESFMPKALHVIELRSNHFAVNCNCWEYSFLTCGMAYLLL